MTQTTNTIASATRLSEAISAARIGQKAMARRILLEVTADHPGSEQAHLWLAAVAESPEESVLALEQVLLLNPGNRQAVNALAVQRLRRTGGGNGGGNGAAKSAAPATESPLAGPPRTALHAPATDMAPLAAAVQQTPSKPQVLPAPRKMWPCALCEHEADKPRPKCPKCGGVLSLVDLNALAENRDCSEDTLRHAIQRWQSRLSDGPSFEANLGIGLAHCNMNQSAVALKFLQEAARLRPHDADVRNAVEGLRARRLVLAVDDSATVRKFVATNLERRGYRVLSAPDGAQAIAMAAESRPDLILLDITMPKIDGYEVCRLIRKTPDIKKVPVVMLSGRDGFFDKMKGKVAGSTDYITKPFDVKTLTGVLDRYLTREQRAY